MASKTMQIIISAKDKASKTVARIKQGMRSLVGIGAKVGLGFAAGLGVATAAIGAMVGKVLEANDNLAKTADRIGVTTEELAGLRHAAALGGVSIGEMDVALRMMSKNVADAANGTGEAQDALEALGLTADALKRQGPAKAFETIIDKLGGMKDSTERMNTAMRIFGRSGGQVLTLTAEGIREARAEAEQFGLALNRADAKKMENINDSIHRIKQGFAGFATVFTVALSDPIEKITGRLSKWAKDGSLKLWATQTALVVVQGFQQIMKITGGAGEVVLAFGRVFNAVYSTAIKTVGGLSSIVLSKAEKDLAAAKAVLASIDETDPRYDATRRAVADLETVAMEAKVIADASVDIVGKSEETARKLANLQGTITQGANNAASELAGTIAKLSEQETAQKKANEEAKKIGDAAKVGADKAVSEIDRITAAYQRLNAAQGVFLGKQAAAQAITSGRDVDGIAAAVEAAERE